MNPNKEKAWFSANGESGNPNAFPADNYYGEPGSAVGAVENERRFEEEHLAKLHAQKIGKESLKSASTPTVKDLNQKPKTSQTTYVDSRGVVHASLADLREAEKGYK